MSENYNGYCMNFSNEELKKYLVDIVKANNTNSIVRYLSENGEEIDIYSKDKIETIVFDGDDENIFVNFYGIHTSIFLFDYEMMFIDEKSRGVYTLSDTYNNMIYEGKLRNKSHEEILRIIAEIILCCIEAKGIEVITRENDKSQEQVFVITVQNDFFNKQSKVFENITINY